MARQRINIPDFQLANSLYVGATVTFWTVTAGGAKTTTKQTLYAAETGTTQLANPQTLDGDGKFAAPVYIDDAVIATISGISGVSDHDTGIIYPGPTWRSDWATATLYFPNDFFRAGVSADNSLDVYVAISRHTSGVFATDLSAGRIARIIDYLGASWKGNWATLTVYHAGEFVRAGAAADSSLDICTVVSDHTSGVYAADVAAGKLVVAIDVSALGDLFATPVIAAGDALKMLRVNAAETAYELRTVAQVRTAVVDTIADAKGDIIVATAADTLARKAAGTDNQALLAASAQADGLAWTTLLPEHIFGLVTALADQAWTPNVGGTATYTRQIGRFIKILNWVIAVADMEINVLGTGSTDNMSGLPYVAGSPVAGIAWSGAVGYFASLAVTTISLNCMVDGNTSYIRFNGLSAAAATSNFLSVFGNGTRIRCMVIYHI